MIAYLYVADMVADVPSPKSEQVPQIEPSLFEFGDSPISEQWKDRLKRKLSERANVFSTDEWDVGLAVGVSHRINVNDKLFSL